MNKFITTLIFLQLLIGTAFAQQQITPLSQFMYNQLVYNPASAGMHESQVNLSVLARLQWSTIQGAPTTGLLWGDYRFKSNNMALGVNVGTSTYSGYSNTNFNLNYAYYLTLTKNMKLSMGLRAGFSSLSFSTNNFRIWDDNDELVTGSTYKKTVPVIGAGLQLNAKNFYVGLSLPDLYAGGSNVGDTAGSKQKRNFVLLSGATIRLGDLYNLKPNLGLFYYPDYGMIAKINATFEIKDYFWFGLTYSTNKSYTAMVGTHISSRIRFGYAFEMTSFDKNINLNTHELNLAVTLNNLFRKKN